MLHTKATPVLMDLLRIDPGFDIAILPYHGHYLDESPVLLGSWVWEEAESPPGSLRLITARTRPWWPAPQVTEQSPHSSQPETSMEEPTSSANKALSYTYIHIYIHICVDKYVYMYIHVCTYTYVYIDAYVYIYTMC